MIRKFAKFLSARRIVGDQQGAYAIEFAVTFPVFLIFALGTFDEGYQLYNRSVLEGEVAKAARDSTLEQNIGNTGVVDDRIRKQLGFMASSAEVDFTRKSFSTFSKARNKEPFTDTNGSKNCDNGEPYEDLNNSGTWDDGSIKGSGGAKDVVVYEAVVTYPRLMPMAGLIGLDEDVTLTARTVVANQPYGKQAIRNSTIAYCS